MLIFYENSLLVSITTGDCTTSCHEGLMLTIKPKHTCFFVSINHNGQTCLKGSDTFCLKWWCWNAFLSFSNVSHWFSIGSVGVTSQVCSLLLTEASVHRLNPHVKRNTHLARSSVAVSVARLSCFSNAFDQKSMLSGLLILCNGSLQTLVSDKAPDYSLHVMEKCCCGFQPLGHKVWVILLEVSLVYSVDSALLTAPGTRAIETKHWQSMIQLIKLQILQVAQLSRRCYGSLHWAISGRQAWNTVLPLMAQPLDAHGRGAVGFLP